MTLLTIIIISCVLTLFNSTRLFAGLVLGAMAYLQPLLLIPIIALATAYFYFTHLK